MTSTTISSKEFEKAPKRASKAAAHGPVFINERGRHAYVLLTVEDYRRLGGGGESIAELLAMAEEIDFDPPRMSDEPVRPADFS